MTKKRRNPNETDKEIIARMNEILVGQPGIVMVTGENRPMYVGTFIQAEREGNLLIRFSNELVLLFEPMMMINVVGDKKEDGSHSGKIICDELYIGSKTLQEIFLDEVEERLHPEAGTVRGLIRETGTFTSSKELIDKFVADGRIRKDGNTLYVSMEISNVSGCLCGFAMRIEEMESVTRDLKNFFGVDEIVYYGLTRTIDDVHIVEFEPGSIGSLDAEHSACNICPIIKGLGMRWEFATTQSVE